MYCLELFLVPSHFDTVQLLLNDDDNGDDDDDDDDDDDFASFVR